MKKNNLSILIFSLVLFACPLVSAQSHQLADKYRDKAEDLVKQGKYIEAARMYEKTVQAEKASQSPRMVTLSAQLNQAGYYYYMVGQYDKAIKYYEESLAIDRKLGKEGDITRGLINIGAAYRKLGQYDKAIKYYEEALVIARKLERKEYVASCFGNIGSVYYFWGQYDKALKYYEEALEINKKLGREENLSINLNNIGLVYMDRGQYDKAIQYFEKALDIDKRLGLERNIAFRLNNIGLVYMDRGQYDKAIKNFEESLAIDKKLGQEDSIAKSLSNIGIVYNRWGQIDKATKYYEEALEINKKLGLEDGIALNLNNLGLVYKSWGQYDRAIKYFKESVSIKEKLRKTATGDVRRDYLASQLDTYQSLTYAYIKDHDVSLAFQTIELSRAKLLAERLAGDESKIKLPKIKQIQETLGKDTVILVYANVAKEDMVQIAITRKEITGKDVPINFFVQSSIDKYDKQIKTLLENQRSISEAKNRFDNIINYYRSLLKGERGLKKAFRESFKIRKANTRELGRRLYGLLIKPLKAQIKDKKNLIIVPDGILAFVPFETLIDKDGRYLVEKHQISYVQSMGIHELIKERKYKEGRKPLLAFGGAVYEKNRSVSDDYGALGIGSWDNLPGTLNEVKNIKKVIKKTKIIKGKKVTEATIKELSQNGKLSKYKVLHFATHGLVVPEMPELSAVVLSQFKNEQGKEDGYLRMGEIAELDVKADFVNLSACETGLGKIYGGEGVVGLTQSFLLAGANAVSVSLWSVADKSTSEFMVSMYDMVHNNDISYADAMTEAKRQFINGNFGEKYKEPYYWAPFVYYGN